MSYFLFDKWPGLNTAFLTLNRSVCIPKISIRSSVFANRSWSFLVEKNGKWRIENNLWFKNLKILCYTKIDPRTYIIYIIYYPNNVVLYDSYPDQFANKIDAGQFDLSLSVVPVLFIFGIRLKSVKDSKRLEMVGEKVQIIHCII